MAGRQVGRSARRLRKHRPTRRVGHGVRAPARPGARRAADVSAPRRLDAFGQRAVVGTTMVRGLSPWPRCSTTSTMASSADRRPAWRSRADADISRMRRCRGRRWPSSIERAPTPAGQRARSRAISDAGPPMVRGRRRAMEQVVAVDEEQARCRRVRRGRSRRYHPRVLLLVDLDGVVYRGAQPVPGMPEVLTAARRGRRPGRLRDQQLALAPRRVRARLRGMGAAGRRRRCIVTAARATAVVLAEPTRHPRAASMVLGGPGLARELRDVGLERSAPTARGLDGDAGRAWSSASTSR